MDASASQIEIHLFHAGLFGGLTGNHLIALQKFSGDANLPDSPPSWHVEMEGRADSLKVLDPWSSESDRKQVQHVMEGPSQIDVAHYPQIKLVSVAFQPTQKETVWNLQAQVTFHGVTRQETFPLNWQMSGSRLQVHGEKMLRLTDFNIQPISRAFGTVRIKDDFKVTYRIVLQRKQ